MKIDTTKYTYEALLAFACYEGLQEFSVTQDRLVDWFERQASYSISKATLSRHLQSLKKAGRIEITYNFTNKAQAVYRFPDGVVTRQKLDLVPATLPGTFDIKDAGTEVISVYSEREVAARQQAMRSVQDIDLDALHDSWGQLVPV